MLGSLKTRASSDNDCGSEAAMPQRSGFKRMRTSFRFHCLALALAARSTRHLATVTARVTEPKSVLERNGPRNRTWLIEGIGQSRLRFLFNALRFFRSHGVKSTG